MHGVTRLLTVNAWAIFQEMFEENGFEVYERRELVMVDAYEQTEEEKEEEKEEENRRHALNELTERLRDKYYRVEEKGQAKAFIKKLEVSLNPIINDLNDSDAF